jgi:membrane protease subunit HflK
MFGSIRKKLGLIFSLNDPRWGRGSPDGDGKEPRQHGRPNDGPPDLDQLWREFNQRINRLLRGKGGGGAGGGSSNDGDDARNAGISAGVAGAVVFFLWLVSGFFIVQRSSTTIIEIRDHLGV